MSYTKTLKNGDGGYTGERAMHCKCYKSRCVRTNGERKCNLTIVVEARLPAFVHDFAGLARIAGEYRSSFRRPTCRRREGFNSRTRVLIR